MNQFFLFFKNNFSLIASVVTIVAFVYPICRFLFKHFRMKKELKRINSQYNKLIKSIDTYGSKHYCSLKLKMEIDNKLESLIDELGAKAGSIYIKYPFDKNWHIFLSQITKGESISELGRMPFRLTSTSAGQCFHTKEISITNDINKNKQFNDLADNKIGFKTRNLLDYPLISNNEVIAVLQIINKSSDFTDEDISYIKNTNDTEFIKLVSDFLLIPDYIDGLDIHDDILNRKKIVVAIDLSSSQNIFNKSKSDITAILVLKEYYNLVSRITTEYGGIVDNYLGDGILISFKYSSNQDERTKEIIKCLIEIKDEFIKLKKTWIRTFNEEDMSSVFIRIGATIGNIKVVNIRGGYNRKTTILGQNVNLAFNICNELPKNRNIIGINQRSYLKIQSLIDVKPIDITHMKKTNKIANGVSEILKIK